MTDLGLQQISQRSATLVTGALRLREGAGALLRVTGSATASTFRALARAPEAYGNAFTSIFMPRPGRTAREDEERY